MLRSLFGGKNPESRQHSELQRIALLFPDRRINLPASQEYYPCIISLEHMGIGAFLLDAHVSAQCLSNVEMALVDLSFDLQRPVGSFQVYTRGHPHHETALILVAGLGEGVEVQIISNSIELLQALPELSPPKPWEVFPKVDADGLGSLQGDLEYWWNNYWWPYWKHINARQRADWLNDSGHPESWCEYIHLREQLDGA